MTLLERIRQKASEQGLTLKSIETTTGLGNGTIRKWDESIPSIDKLYKVANLLNTTVDYLYTGSTPSLNDDSLKLVHLYHQLSNDGKKECLGFIKGYLAHSKKVLK